MVTVVENTRIDMSKMDVTLVGVVGILFQHNLDFLSVMVPPKSIRDILSLRKYALPILLSVWHWNVFPIEITMCCGEKAVYNSEDEIPLVDTPCTCGDPKHYFIKWGEV